MRSMPSLARNRFLIEDSLSAEHNVSNTFSMNSVSSESMGSFRRYCYCSQFLARCRRSKEERTHGKNFQYCLNTIFLTQFHPIVNVILKQNRHEFSRISSVLIVRLRLYAIE